MPVGEAEATGVAKTELSDASAQIAMSSFILGIIRRHYITKS